jgi:hypothetical protein
MNLVYIYYTFNFISLRTLQKSRKHIHTQPAAYGRAMEGWSISPNDVASITPSFVPCETNSSVNEHSPVDACHVEKPVLTLFPSFLSPRALALSLSFPLSLYLCAPAFRVRFLLKILHLIAFIVAFSVSQQIPRKLLQLSVLFSSRFVQ